MAILFAFVAGGIVGAVLAWNYVEQPEYLANLLDRKPK